jgi:amino acid adenylation domain-containing protein
MEDLAERITSLSPKKRELLLRHLAKERKQEDQNRIKPRKRDSAPIPLSFAQQRLWFLDQLDQGKANYNNHLAWILSGQLQVEVIEQGFNEVIRRHEILRTAFPSENGQPVQVIAQGWHLAVQVADVRDIEGSTSESVALALAKEEVVRPFNLSRGPLLRTLLLRLHDDEYVLIFTMHHIVSDGWSVRIFSHDLITLYDSFSRGKPSLLPQLSLQYADFACWQRDRLQGEVLHEQLAYWKSQLGQELPILRLPTDRPRPVTRNYEGAVEAVHLPPRVSGSLKGLGQQEGVTLFIILLAAFYALLYRYTDQQDIIIGIPAANRNRVEIEGLIGFFVNTLALRIKLSGSLKFSELLAETRETALGAYEHEELPFERLVEELQPDRSLGHNPIFQVMCAIQSGADSAQQPLGISIRPYTVHGNTAKFDLMVNILDAPEGLTIAFEYTTDIFDAETIQHMLHYYVNLLEAVAVPQMLLRDLPLLTPAERHFLLFTCNDTAKPYPLHLLLHQLFEAQADIVPQRIALCSGPLHLSYAELERQANCLAHYLISRCTAAESRVAISLPRSPQMIISLLAVLKAGGVCVPLDSSYPLARLRMMLADSRAQLLLINQQTRQVPEATAGEAEVVQPNLVDLDDQTAAFSRESEGRQSVRLDSLNAAYEIYTSGTTGRPKGVVLTHRGIVNRILGGQDTYHLEADDRVLVKAPYTFDASIFENYWPLAVGARLELAQIGGERDSRYLIEAIQERQITVVHFVPGMLAAVLRDAGIEACRSLRRVYCGGEALAPSVVEKYSQRRGAALYNQYGPTETTVNATYWRCETDLGRGRVAIGRAFGNVEVYVVDAQQEVVGIRAVGEIYIGGEGVSRGYVGEEAATAEKFVPDKTGRRAGGRLYRTGDLGRIREGGEVEILGRLDDQVKVRGYRIEPGEVEAALKQESGVAEAVVVPREEEIGGTLLVGYVVEAEGAKLDVGEVKRELRDRLPEWMVPSWIVKLAELPVMANGKLDRRALLEMVDGLKQTSQLFQMPRNPGEEILAGIWTDVLGIDRVGVFDSFFDLGGHSLLATMIISRVREAFQVDIPLRTIFEEPTIAYLAEGILQQQRSGQSVEIPPIVPVSRDCQLPLSFAQQRLWFLGKLHPESVAYNIRLAIHLEGEVNIPALSKCFSEILRRHESLRTILPTVDGEPIQVITPAEDQSLPVIDLNGLPHEARNVLAYNLVDELSYQLFDLSLSPLWRVRLFRLSEGEQVLSFTVHHIVSDGWSTGIIVKELMALYEAFSEGAESSLKEPTLQYADYAHWQRNWYQAGLLETQLTYWKQHLAGAPALLLPTDHPRPAAMDARGKTQTITIAADLAESLKALSRREGATLFMTFLAAFEVLLSRYSRQEDFVIGVPIANRKQEEIEGIVGFFVNMLAIRADLATDPPFRELLKRVRNTMLTAYAYQDLPFEKLVDELKLERNLSYSPLFQVLFVMQNAPRNMLQLPGLQIKPFERRNKTAKFDLTLEITEADPEMLAVIEYNCDLFEEATISRLLTSFATLLESLTDDPHGLVSRLSLLTVSDQEVRQVLIDWNDTRRAYARDASIHQLFEAQVEQMPGAVALMLGDQQLSYAELNRRANQLAHHLGILGIGSDLAVGICIDVSFERIISLLAVLKAGGAYVPLDPSYPLDRLAFMLEDIQAPVILTERRLSEELPVAHGQVICLDSDWQEMTSRSCENLPDWAGADNLAYIIYTSGSTGFPKGVSITHRGVVRLIKETNYVNLNAQEVLLQLAPISFDASTFEIWGSLLNGGRLALMPVQLPSLEEIGEAIRRYEVTTMWLTAGMFHLVVDERVEVLKPLRQLLAGGDVLSVRHVLKMLHEIPGCRLINGYGPTESTTFTCCYSMGQAADVTSTVPIGRPICNTQVYLLDRDLQPAPVELPGELFIGGDGLARCYHNRPELTAERFAPSPFGEEPGERLYRTGDLARYLPDGIIEFLGRMDNQVKIRGFRVEPGEVEAALSRHPALREAIVVARQDGRGEKRLVGYIVPHEQQECAIDELRRYVKERLPDYMVPAAFVKLDALPLNPNGKVDRSALPPPYQEPEDSFIAPRTPIEEILAEIWISVLGIQRAGIHDSFFDLGGDSIRSIQVLARAQQRGLDFSIQQLFEHQTIYELAKEVRIVDSNTLKAQEAAPFSLISEEESQRLGHWIEDAYPMTLLQAGMLFHSELSPGTAVYHDIFSFHIQSLLDLPSLRASISRLMSEHAVLRTAFDQTGFSAPMQLVHRAVDVPLYVTDLTTLSADEQEEALAQWLTRESNNHFDPSKPPLMRFYAHYRSENSFQFGVSFHHAILDGWSFASMMTELFHLYTSLLRNEPFAALPPKATFKQYVALEQTALASHESKHFWSERLANYAVTMLPRWPSSYRMKNDPPVLAQTVPISSETSEGLKRLAHSAGVPIKSVLLASHLRVLSFLSGTPDILTGMVTNGRPEGLDGERVLGLFLNTLPFRLHLPSGSWLDLVKETFRAELEMIPFRHYPLAQIQVNQGRQSLFETGFNFTHYHVYKQIQESNDLAVIGETGMSETNLTFWAAFDLDLVSSRATLELTGAAAELSKEGLILIAGYYERALAAMAENPTATFLNVAVLTAAERQQAEVEWNDTAANFDLNTSIHHLVERQAGGTPDCLALVQDERQLTYGELNSRANQLAHYLKAMGIGPEVLVGTCMNRGLDMAVGLLAILKAGAAYAPLDPAYPARRLAFMVDDLKAPAILAEANTVASVPEHSGRTICLDTEWSSITERSKVNPYTALLPNNLAYVIYTSGSTGKPKGVELEHRGLANFVQWHKRAYCVTPEDRASHMASVAFDASVLEVWPYLAFGATVHIAADETRSSSRRLFDWFRTHGITISFLPTPVAESILEENPPSSLPLRVLQTGGDKLKQRPTAELPFRLANNYGPTEHTVVTTWTPVALSPNHGDSPPIGKPIANTKVYIVDGRGQSVPSNVPGQLCIAGEGLARGYLNRPDLTAERFIPNRLSQGSGDRLYETGDMTSHLPDGNINFLGRNDFQVKIRGFRIEPQEIESVLRQHWAVRDTIVLAKEYAEGEKRLVAYCVPWWEAPGAHAEAFKRTIEAEHVAEWQNSFEDTYRATSPDAQGILNQAAWKSSYTAEPFGNEEMQDWIDCTAERIRALGPRHVLEIGCGAGLLLTRLAPSCSSYCATDFSREALRLAEEQIESSALSQVRLLRRAADDFAGFEPESFDAVVLNSVAQFFPSIDYLLRVIRGGALVTKPGGFVFLGDIRSLRLAKAFYGSVELYQAAATQVTGRLRERIKARGPLEKELLVDPSFFSSLPKWEPALSHVQLQLKRGRHQNEMTRFRYDAVLHVIGPQRWDEGMARFDWRTEDWSISRVKKLLQETDAEVVCLYGVPNARLSADFKLLDLLETVDPTTTVADLRELTRCCGEAAGIDPEDFWALAAESPYNVNVTWSTVANDESFDVILIRNGTRPIEKKKMGTPYDDQAGSQTALAEYANNPLRDRFERKLVPELRGFLQETLPAYMVPSFVVMGSFPLTNSGKVDRAAFFEMDELKPLLDAPFVAPRDALELRLATIWEEVLGIQPIGVRDNFFELGGHSLLAVALMGKIGRMLGASLPLATLFQGATIEYLAARFRERTAQITRSPLVPSKPDGLMRPLFCVHPAGGNVLCYTELAQQLGAEQPFYGLQAQPMDDQQIPFTRVEDIAALYTSAIRTVQPEGPYLIAGWSMGGVVGYEMAQQLQADNHEVALLALLDAYAPVTAKLSADGDDANLLAGFAQNIGLSAEDLLIPWEDLMALDEDYRLGYILDRLKLANILTPDIELAQARNLFHLFKGNVQAFRSYVPKVYSGRITLFRAAYRADGICEDPTLGWGDLAAGGVEIHDVPGTHYTMIKAPQVQYLASELTRSIRESGKG